MTEGLTASEWKGRADLGPWQRGSTVLPRLLLDDGDKTVVIPWLLCFHSQGVTFIPPDLKSSTKRCHEGWSCP